MAKNMKNVDIDLVYLWVDGGDPNWLEKKNLSLKELCRVDEEIVGDVRFRDNDDLKYSLRSVEKFAPWVNKIYIVTDNQIPQWLNVNHPKIKIVDHTEIIPKEYLPTFNSCGIESCIANIKNLSEHFLLACDDFLFWNKVNKNFFYKKKNFLINRIKHRLPNEPSFIYDYHIMNAKNIIENEFGTACRRYPHHNIYAYLKSDYIECVNKFEQFKNNVFYNIRSNENVSHVIASDYSVACNRGCYKKVKPRLFHKIFGGVDSYQVTVLHVKSDVKECKKRLKQLNPKLACFNDTIKTPAEDKEDIFSERNVRFPEKSGFEL